MYVCMCKRHSPFTAFILTGPAPTTVVVTFFRTSFSHNNGNNTNIIAKW